MKQKKVLKLWQMILIVILSFLMIVTMFLPVFRINGSNVRKAAEKIMSDSEEDVEEDSIFLKSIEDKSLDVFEETFDDKISDWEKDNDAKIASVSPLRFMTHNFFTLVYGNDITDDEIEQKKEDDAYSEISQKYTLVRVLLWVIYLLSILVLLLTLLGFILKWSKWIPLIISTVYGVFASVVFAVLRFALLGSVESSLKSVFGRALKKHFKISFDLSTLKFPELFNEVIPSFYSIAFLAAFVIAVLLLSVSVTAMFTGNRIMAEDDWYDSALDEVSNNIEISQPVLSRQAGMNPFGSSQPGFEHMDSFTETANGPTQSIGPTMLPEQKPVISSGVQVTEAFIPDAESVFAPPMGQVKCTKGSALGSGFMLPQDRKVIVGKNPQQANLVISHPNVSNLHCTIRYKAESNSYIVKDHSMNGTFVGGMRLKSGIAYEFPAGTVLSLADGSNQITVG